MANTHNDFSGLARSTLFSTTVTPSGGTLTLKKLKKMFDIAMKYEEKEQKRIAKLVKNKSWKKQYRQLHKLAGWVLEQDRLDDYSIVIQCIYSITPHIMMPVSIRTAERCEELLTEMLHNEK